MDNPTDSGVFVVHTLTQKWTAMKLLRSTQLTLYADLLQQLQETSTPAGSVRTQKIKDKEYLKANTTIGIQRTTRYIGRADDPDAQKKAAAIQEEMHRAKARRQTVGLLHRSGVPGPTTELGSGPIKVLA